ncbi:PQQ-binding-like beta-propeller repeat protein [Cellulomonas sp. PhB150]|uniref:outer membrane protein assembly factor BamB family protein n=1 Tax=Cellulomonas sp. PhB150 TaxID=2485188 RepID=UPI000F47EBE8|nr:PQQ-binding-like beta-propeller repeat protein [Cellulomonas sp. PhB150]ROS31699.1 putative pyrroloquinoline-quinone binding quinoprotein [Cellulomonas sp. PhB150]
MGRTAVSQVELLEDEPVGDEPRPRSRWRRWWPVPVVLALLAVGLQTGLDARARAHDERIASLPGTLAPVGEALTVQWKVSPDDYGVVSAGYEVDGAYVGMRRAADETFAAVALDAGTGLARWSTGLGPRGEGEGAPIDAGNFTIGLMGSPYCVPGGAADVPVLACLVDSHRGLVVVDATSGTVLRREDLPTKADLLAVDGGTTYLARSTGTDCEVTALGATSVLWTTTVACGGRPELVVAGGLVAVGSTREHVTVLTSSGEIVEESDDGAAAALGDRIALFDLAGDGTGTSRLLSAGAEPVAVDGIVMVPRVDDGSAPDVVVTSDRTTRGFDARTGKKLWEAPDPLSGIYLLRDGDVVGSSDQDALVTIDARSGAVHHRAALRPDTLPSSPVTDGPTYLTMLRGAPSDAPRLLAVSADGDDRSWDVQLPGGLLGLIQLGRHLVGSDRGGTLMVLG